jgi:hypothetical protein
MKPHTLIAMLLGATLLTSCASSRYADVTGPYRHYHSSRSTSDSTSDSTWSKSGGADPTTMAGIEADNAAADDQFRADSQAANAASLGQ